MKYCSASQGRIFIIRLEDGEILHECVEKFAAEQGVHAAWLLAVGGADARSRLVVGPKEGRAQKIESQILDLADVHEVVGMGTLFPDETGRPILHMHMAAGRGDRAITGCTRSGVVTWHVLEVIMVELLDHASQRILDSKLGFKLLIPRGS